MRLGQRCSAALEPTAIVFTQWNCLYPYYYAAHIVQGKTEIRFFEAYLRADTQGLAASLKEYIATHIDSQPIFVTWPDATLLHSGFAVKQVQMGPQQWFRLERGR